MSADIEKLYKQVEQFCKNPSPLPFDEAKLLLNDLHKVCFYEADFLKRNKLEQLIDIIRRSSATDLTTYGHILHSIAFREYKDGNIDFAEYLFRRACDLVDDYSLNNNLAYVLRRKKDDSITTVEIITLLLPGVREQDSFCMINMGLLFALNLSASDDWQTADELFSLLPDELNGADAWWESLAKEGDIEGYLVFFFLLRHGKIDHSNIGSVKSIAMRLIKSISGFPDWLAKVYAIETLNDVVECIDDPDFYPILEDFLEKMPCSRESVDEMLKVVSGWDLLPVYNKLLIDRAALLTPEELAKLRANYKKKFDLPLPGETD